MKISATNTAEREIVSTSNFDAPRELVWRRGDRFIARPRYAVLRGTKICIKMS